MAFKRVNITFIGGNNDGELIENVSVNQLRPELSFRSQEDIYFVNHPSGDMSIMKGKLNKLWHSYSVSVYKISELAKASQVVLNMNSLAI
jgi:hypothetical protein